MEILNIIELISVFFITLPAYVKIAYLYMIVILPIATYIGLKEETKRNNKGHRRMYWTNTNNINFDKYNKNADWIFQEQTRLFQEQVLRDMQERQNQIFVQNQLDFQNQMNWDMQNQLDFQNHMDMHNMGMF